MTILYVSSAFFVFQSSVSRDQFTAHSPCFFASASTVLLMAPYGGRMSVGATPMASRIALTESSISFVSSEPDSLVSC